MRKIIFAVILTVLFSACGDASGGGTGTGGGAFGGKSGEPSVYIGGWYEDGGAEKACYWIDGKRYELNGYRVENITTVRGTVYAAGCYDDGGTEKACYWVNKTRRDLPGFFYLSYLRNPFPNISVDRGSVYISGLYGSSFDDAKGSYWVNGVSREPTTDGFVQDAYAANGSVYMSGFYTDGGILKPCWWVNGSRRELSNIMAGSPDFIYSTITVANNKAYIACGFWLADEEYSSYWIDGVQQKIIFNKFVEALAIYEGDLYMTGGGGFDGIYKNGELYASGWAHRSAGLAVFRGKTYTCGSESGIACYWIDGEQFFLDGAYANAIFVEE